MNSTLAAGLAAIANATSVDAVDRIRRSVDDHAAEGRLTADQAAALSTVCRARALELAERDASATAPAPVHLVASLPAAPSPVAMTLVAAMPAPAARAGVPAGFVEGEYAAVVASAVERDYDDSGAVLLLTLTADVDGEPVEVRVRFDGNREAARAAAFRSCGLLAGSDPAMLIGKPCRVLLAPWTSSDGRARLVVKRWVAPPKSAAPAAPAASRPAASALKFKAPPKSARPAWEGDDGIPF
jgi:hypothetical protein